MSPGLVLAPVADPTHQTVFSELTKSGVDTTKVDSPFFIDSNQRIVHLYPVSANDSIEGSVGVGDDFMLFYEGRNRYSWAAKIRGSGQDRDGIRTLLDRIDVSEPEAFSGEFLLLDIPFPVEIPSHELHDSIELEQEALTRFIHVDEDRIDQLISNYGSLQGYLLSQRKPPTVWIEKTELNDRPYKQAGGEYELGTSVFSRSKASDGREIYETLREATVGDIVIHLLQDRNQITGVSIVTSTLREDFEGPPDDSWPNSARGRGYFRPLARYQELDDPIDIYVDILENDTYRSRLHTIYEEYDGLVYDTNRSLNEGAYFTRCPVPLLYLFLAENGELIELCRDRYYEIPFPDPADTYESVTETVVDIRIRLAFTDEGVDWFQDRFTATILDSLTETLTKIQPNARITQKQAAHCELISAIYNESTDRLESVADDLGIASANQVSPAKALFFVLFRDLQSWADVSTNMNHVKLRTILKQDYTVETPRPQLVESDEIEPLDETPKPQRAEDIARQLSEVGQMIFHGPPGTSKTYTAEQFARWWLHQQPNIEPDTSHLTTVTFHPSFTYEDFIEGLSAEVTEEKTVAYEHDDGIFKEMADRARLAYQETPKGESIPRYILIIDEINRGNLAQIFGETITALEYDKRMDQPNETTVNLAHTGDPFQIPPNLYLIGTMNTADRSIALVDTALRRRFRFLPFPPNFETLYETKEFPFDSQDAVETKALNGAGTDGYLLALSIRAIQNFNKSIIDATDLGKGKQIGHSYFFQVDNAEDIVDIWRFELLPLLEEYYFGQFERIRDELFNGGGQELFDYEREQIRSFDATDLETTLAKLIGSPT